MKRIIQPVGMALFCLTALMILGFNDFNGFTDAGIHYAFAEELARFRQWPLPATTSVGMMSHYPPAAHLLSLLIGWLAGSTLYGLFIVTAISFIIIYTVLAELMRREAAPNTALTFLVFLLIALVCRSGRFLEGNEIVANFFFAQFAGTAGLLASFLILCRLRSKTFVLWLGAAALATHLVGWIYTINGIELALACVMFQVVDFLRNPSKQSAGKVFCSAVILGAAAVIHPTMIGSLGIAANDGSISISTTSAIVSYLTLVLGTLLLMVSPPRSKLVNHDIIVALSLGVLAACTLQAIAFGFFSIGSAYAVKKYGFLTGTMSILIFACLLADRIPDRYALLARRLPRLLLTIMVPLLGIASLFIVTAFRPKTPVHELVMYDREVRQFVSRNRNSELEGKTASWSSRFSPHINYTVGLGLLRPLEAADDQHALLLPNPRISGTARYLLVDVGKAEALEGDCIVSLGESLAAIRTTCDLKPLGLPK